jgi:putative phosphoribosyl transferase
VNAGDEIVNHNKIKTISVSISILESGTELKGLLTIPNQAKAIIVFAHGSGSGRLSPRNQFVSHFLEKEGHATLLLDLLTEKEEIIDLATGSYRFNIPLLAKRLIHVVKWLRDEVKTTHLKIAFFGASTGSAAALIATADLGSEIFAIVSRGGRPDIAIDVLHKITTPTLLIVGSKDEEVIALNQKAYEKLTSPKEMQIVENASHLFEENGALQEVAKLAASWFKKHL